MFKYSSELSAPMITKILDTDIACIEESLNDFWLAIGRSCFPH